MDMLMDKMLHTMLRFLILVSVFALCGCGKEENDIPNPRPSTESSPLIGHWYREVTDNETAIAATEELAFYRDGTCVFSYSDIYGSETTEFEYLYTGNILWLYELDEYTGERMQSKYNCKLEKDKLSLQSTNPDDGDEWHVFKRKTGGIVTN